MKNHATICPTPTKCTHGLASCWLWYYVSRGDSNSADSWRIDSTESFLLYQSVYNITIGNSYSFINWWQRAPSTQTKLEQASLCLDCESSVLIPMFCVCVAGWWRCWSMLKTWRSTSPRSGSTTASWSVPWCRTAACHSPSWRTPWNHSFPTTRLASCWPRCYMTLVTERWASPPSILLMLVVEICNKFR